MVDSVDLNLSEKETTEGDLTVVEYHDSFNLTNMTA